jgi:hypothetical protein
MKETPIQTVLDALVILQKLVDEGKGSYMISVEGQHLYFYVDNDLQGVEIL